MKWKYRPWSWLSCLVILALVSFCPCRLQAGEPPQENVASESEKAQLEESKQEVPAAAKEAPETTAAKQAPVEEQAIRTTEIPSDESQKKEMEADSFQAKPEYLSGQTQQPPSPAPVPAAPVPTQVTEVMDAASFLNAQVHDLAVQLIRNFNGEVGPDSPVAVTTFVDLNNLYKTSPFGRYLAEQLMGELQRAGFRVVEVRKTDSILVKEHYGEYSLSREISEIAKEASAQLVLVGTYITRGRYILINSRLVSNRGNILTSSAMKILRRDRFLDRMLWPAMAPDTGPSVKIPIKEFGQPTEVRIISGS